MTRIELRRQSRHLGFVAGGLATMAVIALALPVAADPVIYGESLAGTAITVGTTVIKTAVPDQMPIVPEIYTPKAGCKLAADGTCVVYLPVGVGMQPADSYSCSPSNGGSHGCDGVDPVAVGCADDAKTVADFWWHVEYGDTLYVANRWSQACQSNWGLFADRTQSTTIDVGVGYYGWSGSSSSMDSRTYFQANNATEVFGQMLYGGYQTPCVFAVGYPNYYHTESKCV